MDHPAPCRHAAWRIGNGPRDWLLGGARWEEIAACIGDVSANAFSRALRRRGNA